MKIGNLKEKLISTGLVVLIIAVMYLLEIPCLFKALFHICCPGCGMTRAYLSLLRFDIRKAFEYHPMFWAVPVWYLMYLFDDKLFKPRWVNTCVSVVIYSGFFINWVYRLIVGGI